LTETKTETHPTINNHKPMYFDSL